jgi:GT2 family glycosyltransferase/glycosyltransferase involved in cell wall biosynthesis
LTPLIVLETPRRLVASSPWVEHLPVAMWLVDLVRPAVLVELGSRIGDSYCACCQAVAALGLGTRCYGLGDWSADPDGPQILRDLRAHHDPLYDGFSRLIDTAADKAIPEFAGASIDLLHVADTAEPLRHTLDTWLPKMSVRGVVLLHGINGRDGPLDASRVWSDLRRAYPSFEFFHGRGLGVLGVGAALPDSLRPLLSSSEEGAVALRRQFDRLGHRLRLLTELPVAERRLADERQEGERVAAALQAALRHARTEAAERAQAADWLKADLERARQQLVNLQQAAAKLGDAQWEASRLRHEVDTLRGSWSWKLTIPVRRLGAATQSVAGIPRRLTRAWSRLQSGWDRIAYDSIPLSTLTPVAVEGGAAEPQGRVRWVPPSEIGEPSAALVTPPPARVTYRLAVPASTSFRSLIGLALADGDRALGGVDVSVSASIGHEGRHVEKRWRLDPVLVRDRRWMECRMGLGGFRGQEVELTLSVSLPAGASADSPEALWGDPVVRARRSLPEIWRAWRGTSRQPGMRSGSSHGRETVAGGHAALTDSLAAAATSSPRGSPGGAWRHKLELFLSDPASALVFPTWPDPVVSIVVPSFNRAEDLYQCLESVLAHTTIPFEVIVIDDGSEDDTPQLLQRVRNVTWARNDENREFIRTCNRGIGLAKGRYLLFLNNDVTVTPQWVATLVETMQRDPRCGAVGAKLVRPDGTLQEAGSIIWRDGTAFGYGRDDDPLKPEYAYVREVDYCSAACLLVRAELVRELGGFDERYVPAYYEDADLCLGIRQRGWKVVFQPRVSVFHREYGSRSRERADALCAANRSSFALKWFRELEGHRPSGDVLRARDRRPGPRVLVMDDEIPAPELGSGLPRTFTMLTLLAEAGFVVTFVPLVGRTRHQPVTGRLQQLGIEVFYGDGFRWEELLRSRAGYYDIVLVSRPHNGYAVLPLAREHFPSARIVYDAEALFSTRDFRKAQLDGLTVSEPAKQAMVRQELDIMKLADVVITVSEGERDTILREAGYLNVAVWGHARQVREPVTPFSERADLLFVGAFLNEHPPNVDGVLYFATTLFPRIRHRLPGCRFVIAGSQPPASVRDLAGPDIVVTGYVEDLTTYYERCRVFVVPLRFGGGISLKLIEAMSEGIPAVVSRFGGVGLDLDDGREALVAERDDEFVDKVVRLYEDEVLWTTVQRAAQRYVRRNFSRDAMRDQLANLLVPADGSGTE